ncbi:hypothetical protein [Streptomonospora arabica]|uniref:Transcriptional regulator n=1 Tax=Streptomonospora arabica TaxID=412417 RepID=A0ABV9SK40_9ACTN
MSEPNVLLTALIAEAGVSNAGLASRVNQVLGTRYDHTAVARWIRDRAVPRGRAPQVICDVLSHRVGRPLTMSDIGMERADSAPPPGDLEATVSRTTATWRQDARDEGFLQGARPTVGAGAILPLFEWENPPGDVDVSRRGQVAIGEPEVQRLQVARRRYEEMYRRAGGIPVRPRLARFLSEQVTPLLSASYTDATGRRLHRTVGSLTALAGICAYDASRQALAQRYFLAALRMAKASGDRAFGAYIVALLSNQAMAAAEYRLVIQYCDTALRAAGGGRRRLAGARQRPGHHAGARLRADGRSPLVPHPYDPLGIDGRPHPHRGGTSRDLLCPAGAGSDPAR